MNKELILLFLVLFSTMALAQDETVLTTSLLIHKDHTVGLGYIDVYTGEASVQESGEGDYSFQIIGDNGEIIHKHNFDLMFILLSDPPMETGAQGFRHIVPYSNSMKKVILLHEDKEIFSQDISSFCLANANCDEEENYWSCSEDCPPAGEDGFCNSGIDDMCDPDCFVGADPDCVAERVNSAEDPMAEWERLKEEVIVSETGRELPPDSDSGHGAEANRGELYILLMRTFFKYMLIFVALLIARPIFAPLIQILLN